MGQLAGATDPIADANWHTAHEPTPPFALGVKRAKLRARSGTGTRRTAPWRCWVRPLTTPVG